LFKVIFGKVRKYNSYGQPFPHDFETGTRLFLPINLKIEKTKIVEMQRL